MEPDLDALFLVESAPTDALDTFVSDCLFEGGVWESPRTSDGIEHIERVLERGPERLRVCGRIYSIDQMLHTFWLELARDSAGNGVTWFLYFDVVETSERRARNAVTSHDHAQDIDWRVRLAGKATATDGVLGIVPGSTRHEDGCASGALER